MPGSEIIFRKRSVHKYVHIYICEKLYTKNTIFELGIDIGSSFSGMMLNAFWGGKKVSDKYLFNMAISISVPTDLRV